MPYSNSEPVSPRPWRQRKKLGEILIESNLLDEEELTKALAEQKKDKVKLGQWLINNGYLTADQIMTAVSQQLKLDIYEPSNEQPEPELVKLVPEDIARQYQLAPVEFEDGLLRVAVLDPTDITGLDWITTQEQVDVEPMITTHQNLSILMNALYGSMVQRADESTRGLLEEFAENDSSSFESDLEKLDNFKAEALAQDAPVVRLANTILVQAVKRHTSDIHLMPMQDKVSLRFRIDGELVEFLSLPKSIFLPLCSRLKLLSNMDISVTRIPQDGRFSFTTDNSKISVRASSLPTTHGEKIVMRLLDQTAKPRTLEQLGLRSEEQNKIEEATKRAHGMILATGPTGSGKTTLLYSLLQRINKPNINIVTLEDPVEYQLDGVAQVQLNRKAGMTFASGLRSILRQDPDVILVGEIRDQETATIAIESSLTGHKVLSTLHTNDAPGAVTRFVEMGVEPFLIASTLNVVVAQRLVRRLCEKCRQEYLAPPDELKMMGIPQNKKVKFYKSNGCTSCNNTGYSGRVAVCEVMDINDSIRHAILQRASSTEIKQIAIDSRSFRTLRLNAAAKVLEGITSFEEFLKIYSN